MQLLAITGMLLHQPETALTRALIKALSAESENDS